jgi:hypothetical protein
MQVEQVIQMMVLLQVNRAVEVEEQERLVILVEQTTPQVAMVEMELHVTSLALVFIMEVEEAELNETLET